MRSLNHAATALMRRPAPFGVVHTVMVDTNLPAGFSQEGKAGKKVGKRGGGGVGRGGGGGGRETRAGGFIRQVTCSPVQHA